MHYRIVALMVLGIVAAMAVSIPALAAPTNSDEPADFAANLNNTFVGSCAYVKSSEDDPIAQPSHDGAHVHEFFGNPSLSNDSTRESLNAVDTNCTREALKSSYWVPRITWGGQVVTPTHTGVYYATGNGLPPEGTQTMPFGFKAIAFSESSETRTDGRPVEDGARAIVDWHCTAAMNVRDSMKKGPIPPDYCEDKTLGVTMTFPECWDGKSFNVKGGANMRHAVVRNGKRVCPEGFPKYVPRLQLFINYKLPQAEGPLKVLGHDGMEHDPTFFHADYFNSEHQGRLTQTCIREGKALSSPICKRRL